MSNETKNLKELAQPVASVVRWPDGLVASLKMPAEDGRDYVKQGFITHQLYSQEYVDALQQRVAELEAIKAAAEKLVRCKGRYHSEQNYRALAALFGVTTPDLPPVEGDADA